MAFTIPGATLKITQGLFGVAHIGVATPKLAKAIASGVDQWIHGIPVLTTDTGSVGAGQSTCPLTMPPPALQPFLALGFANEKIIGPMAPLTITGLAIGLSNAFLDAQVIASHPGVVGACVIQFGPFSAVPAMLQGFKNEGMAQQGSLKMARAIGFGLDQAFGAFSLPCPIPGAPGPSPAAGRGFGFVL